MASPDIFHEADCTGSRTPMEIESVTPVRRVTDYGVIHRGFVQPMEHGAEYHLCALVRTTVSTRILSTVST